jgi:hypothetical protein
MCCIRVILSHTTVSIQNDSTLVAIHPYFTGAVEKSRKAGCRGVARMSDICLPGINTRTI